MGYDQDALAKAFALTAGAGMATALGASLVFFPSLHTPEFLGMSLAFAAGVMLYVSFVEIFIKASDEFELHFDELEDVNRSAILLEDYDGNSSAYHCTMATFFAGIVLTYVLERVIHRIKGEAEPEGAAEVAFIAPFGVGGTSPDELFVPADESTGGELPRAAGRKSNEKHAAADSVREEDPSKQRSLMKTALIAGAAIILHNFPEGLATFIATAEDPSVGASLAIAIGVHNIPEGIVVAIPILHATGSKWKAFFWGAVSGLAETVAGAIGWIVLSSTDGDISSLGYALLFGLVAGMMVYICLKELIPTAHKYDKHDKYATNCCILGMLVMAASLSLFVG